MKTIFASILLLLSAAILSSGFSASGKRTTDHTTEIGIKEANTMIERYIRQAPPQETMSLFATADTLRQFLNNGAIRQLKFFLARKADSTLTLVIAGVDDSDNYVYGPDGGVYDELMPCPPECPDGESGSDLLPEK